MNWSYVAGFFDGEGCVSKSNRKTYSVTICQADFQGQVLLDISEFLESEGIGSAIYSAGKSIRPCSNLMITNQRSLLKFLESVLPFIIVKRVKSLIAIEQAKISIARMETRKSNLAKAIEMYSSGMSLKDAAELNGCDGRTLKADLERRGVVLRPIGTNQFSGKTQKSIAWIDEFGMHLNPEKRGSWRPLRTDFSELMPPLEPKKDTTFINKP